MCNRFHSKLFPLLHSHVYVHVRFVARSLSTVSSPLCMEVFFEDNPRDLQVLRHDKVLQPKRVQPHLKHVPSYLGEVVCVCVRKGRLRLTKPSPELIH